MAALAAFSAVWPRRLLCCGAVATALVLSGCAQPPSPPALPDAALRTVWHGRLAVQVQDQPSRSFIAAFDLQGNAHSGSLQLSSPLGSTLAQLHWNPQGAQLNTGERTEQADSIEALLERGTGAAIPVTALFDWLSGLPTPVEGWSTDLSAIAQGRLNATRWHPEPQTSLRITFER